MGCSENCVVNRAFAVFNERCQLSATRLVEQEIPLEDKTSAVETLPEHELAERTNSQRQRRQQI
ncbi:hypothetical protein [Burkholderia gladioli]|uniref:hypothetical protein n=1 Tax=Burkholderia gladioli TaxID=28095 RepID=UPI0006273AC5|nr:hypothetical protein [Burkholderia gladioli]